MAHVPMDDVNALWSATEGNRNWQHMKQVLEGAEDSQKLGISNDLVNTLIKAMSHFEQSGQQFPDSPDKLSEVLNNEVEKGNYQQSNMG